MISPLYAPFTTHTPHCRVCQRHNMPSSKGKPTDPKLREEVKEGESAAPEAGQS